MLFSQTASALTQSLDASHAAFGSRVMKGGHSRHGKVWFIGIRTTLQGHMNTFRIVVVDSSKK